MFKFRACLFLTIACFSQQIFASEKACTCDEMGVQENMGSSDTVFTGRVENIYRINSDEYAAILLVYHGWKNVEFKRVSVLSSYSQQDCGFDLEIGQEYLIYGFTPAFARQVSQDQNRKATDQSFKIVLASNCGGSKELKKVSISEKRELGGPHFTAYRQVE